MVFDEGNREFELEATTGVAVWTWLDYPAGGEMLRFADNGFLLLRGRRRAVGVTVVGGGDVSGEGVKGVTVESLWNNTLLY